MRLVLVLGIAQQGKTTLALRLLHKRTSRLLMLDPVRSKPFSKFIAENPGAVVCQTWTELASFLGSANGKWRVILRSINDADYAEVFRNARHLRHVTILADEMLFYSSDGECYEWLRKCARANAHYGDGLGVPLWITAQRPTDVPPDIRSQATQIITFRQEEPADLQRLSERCSPAFATAVASLVDHEWGAFPPMTGAKQNERRSGVPYGSAGSASVVGAIPGVPTSRRDAFPSASRKVTQSA